MSFVVREHGGLSPEQFERPFFLKHFAPYRFSEKIVEEKKVLEIGFGDGYGSFYLAPYVKDLIAIDLFFKNIALAQKKYQHKNLKFLAMNGYELAFKERIFDAVLAFQLIEHIPRAFHNKFLQEIKRVLKEDGFLILTTPNLLCLQKKGREYAKNPHHDLEFSDRMLFDLLKEYFSRIDIYKVDYSFKQRFFLRLKKIGLFKYLPSAFNPVDKYFKNMNEEDFAVKKGPVKKAPDILAVCFMS